MILALDLNPLPWTSGSVAVGRKGGKMRGSIYKDESLETYQQAVKGEIERMDLSAQEIPPSPWKLTFYFWRELEAGKTAAGSHRRGHQSDATNMQKALEDALQGTLIGNDRDVSDIRSVIVAQGPDVTPGIVIVVSQYLDSIDVPNAVEKMYRAACLPVAPVLDLSRQVPKDVF